MLGVLGRWAVPPVPAGACPVNSWAFLRWWAVAAFSVQFEGFRDSFGLRFFGSFAEFEFRIGCWSS